MRLRIRSSSECPSYKLFLFKEVVLLCGLSRTCRQCYTYEWDIVQPMESPLWSDQSHDAPSPIVWKDSGEGAVGLPSH